MPEITSNFILLSALVAAGILVGIHVLVSLASLFALRAAARERIQLSRELYGLVKKIEGLTSSRREQMLKHYDGLLEVLSSKLPTAVASHTSQVIFDTESKILSRLAELEPNLATDEKSKQKLDELIKSMEGLERTIVTLTSDAVRNVMIDGRRALFEGDSDMDIKLAA